MSFSRQIAVGDVAPLSLALLGKSGAASSITGTLTETALATITIPGNTIGVNGLIRVTALWSYPNTANTKTFKVRLGGISGTTLFSTTASTFTVMKSYTDILNRNSASSQVAMSIYARGTDGLVTTGGAITGAVDTTVSQDLVISAQLGNTGETITLEGYVAEYIK